jgi:hypothetical protein
MLSSGWIRRSTTPSPAALSCRHRARGGSLCRKDLARAGVAELQDVASEPLLEVADPSVHRGACLRSEDHMQGRALVPARTAPRQDGSVCVFRAELALDVSPDSAHRVDGEPVGRSLDRREPRCPGLAHHPSRDAECGAARHYQSQPGVLTLLIEELWEAAPLTSAQPIVETSAELSERGPNGCVVGALRSVWDARKRNARDGVPTTPRCAAREAATLVMTSPPRRAMLPRIHRRCRLGVARTSRPSIPIAHKYLLALPGSTVPPQRAVHVRRGRQRVHPLKRG